MNCIFCFGLLRVHCASCCYCIVVVWFQGDTYLTLRFRFLCRIQFPILVWISSALSANAYWKPELLKEISLFNLLDLLMVFLAFFIVNMVSSQGKSTYFSGMCLIFAYVVYLLVNYYE